MYYSSKGLLDKIYSKLVWNLFIDFFFEAAILKCHLSLVMIEFTESAAQKIKSMEESFASDNMLLRIFVEAGGCSGFEYGMGFDELREGDQRLESQGISFIMDEASLTYMKGSVVDFDDGLQGKGFEIKNPNATNTCGCGRSFS